MTVAEILFYFFVSVTALSAAAIVFSRNVFKSALFLLSCLLSIAALYALTFAEFLAVTQILIYAGGILVVIIFGIMLTTRMSGKPLAVKNTNILTGAIAGVSLLTILVRYLSTISQPGTTRLSPAAIDDVGLVLFSEFSLPFEIAGLLLLIALIGAAVITSNLKSKV